MALVQANKIDDMATAVKTAVLTIGNALMIVGWVIAGIIYLTSGGDPGKLGIAKKAMIAAIVGTALVLIGSTAASITEFIQDALGIGAAPN